MSNASGIKVKGFKSAQKALEAIGVPQAEIKAAGNQAGQLVAREARNLVPVRTGKLLASIRVNNALRNVMITAGNNGKVPYANPIHWGWFKRNIKPQPFFTKALGITRDEVYKNYYRTLDTLIAFHSTKGTEE
jgi:HK97 gp10 family phage protein